MVISIGGIKENSGEVYKKLDSSTVSLPFRRAKKIYKMIEKNKKKKLFDCTCDGLANTILLNNWKSTYSIECMAKNRLSPINYNRSDLIGIYILNCALQRAPLLKKRLRGSIWISL